MNFFHQYISFYSSKKAPRGTPHFMPYFNMFAKSPLIKRLLFSGFSESEHPQEHGQ